MRSTSKKTSSPASRAKGIGPGRDSVVRLRMPSRRDAVAPTVERILGAVARAGLSRDQKDDLAVALAEALSNAAVHGNRLRPGSQVSVTIRVTPGENVVVDISDSGRGFDLSALSDPTDPSNILAPSGRGIFLMRRLVDHVEYGSPGNRVRLTVEPKRRRFR